MKQSTEEYEASPPKNNDLALLPVDADVDAVPLRGRRVTIGRSRTNDVVVDDSFVSSRHCQVEEQRGVYRVMDLGSRNGTRLNGVFIEGGRLKAGDRLRVGQAVLLCVGRARGGATWEAPGGLVGQSLPMRRALLELARYARRDAPVLIEGETGTGKELAARSVHQLSKRRRAPFVAVNCGALTPELAMSELFGHERGAFTGAALQHRGAFEQADRGTLFLDEVGELDGRVQAALLRTLETGHIRRVGSESDLPVRVRVVAATNRDLPIEIQSGTFRLDLFHRLAVLLVRLPPLRHRLDDLPELTDTLLERMGGSAELTDEALMVMAEHTWPGNVRELRNVLERACALSETGRITAGDLRISSSPDPSFLSELSALQLAVRKHGSIAAAARSLGMPRTTLRDRIQKLKKAAFIRARR